MSSRAYLSQTYLRYYEPSVFPVALISYDEILVNQDLSDLPWTSGSDPDRFAARLARSGLSGVAVAQYLGDDPNVLALVRKNLVDIRKVQDKYLKRFIAENFPVDAPPGEVLPLQASPLFEHAIRYFESRGYDMTDSTNLWDALVIVMEMFVSHFLNKRLGAEPILMIGELQFRESVRQAERIPLSSPAGQPPIVFTKYVGADFSDELGAPPSADNSRNVGLLLDLTVPNFSDIPIIEIARLKKKDKLASIPVLAENLAKTSRNDPLEFAKRYIDHLWSAGKTLKPSIGEHAVGILGNAPFPIINPIGLVGSTMALKKEFSFNKNYDWFIALARLQSLQAKHVPGREQR